MLRAMLMAMMLTCAPAVATAAPDNPTPSEFMQTDQTQPAGLALAALAPRFVIDWTAARIGVSFDCPACRLHRVVVNVDPPFDAVAPAEHPWARRGDTWDNLTLSPSIVAHRRDQRGQLVECWHGHIRSGRAV